MNTLKITKKGLRCPFVVLEKDGRRVEVRGVAHFADTFFFERVYFIEPNQVIQHEAVMFRQARNPMHIVMRIHFGVLKLGLACQDQFMVKAKKRICDEFEDVQKVKSALDGNTNSQSHQSVPRQGIQSFTMPTTRVDLCRMIIDSLADIKKLRIHRQLVQSRDETAALYADCVNDSDIVLIWGTAHVKGIVKNLKRLGWKKLSTKWVTAIAF